MYPRDKSCKYARRGAISAVNIVIIPGIINYEKKKKKFIYGAIILKYRLNYHKPYLIRHSYCNYSNAEINYL